MDIVAGKQRAVVKIWIVSDIILAWILYKISNYFPGCQFATVTREEGAVVSRDL